VTPVYGGGAFGAAPAAADVAAMWNNPFIRSQIDAMLSENPETLRAMLEADPTMRQAMEANPELRAALSDPETIRQMMNAATNPALMAEQMRNNDRAMSNITSMPGGFNALTRMYRDIQEPLERAQRQRANETERTTGTPVANPDGPIPNPWGDATATTPTTPTMPTSTGGASPASPFGGLGALGDPTSQLEHMAQMMSNPQMRSAIENVMSNPQMLESMLSMHPEARQMMDANPGMRDTLANPDFFRQMMNPENLRAMAQMQQAMNTLQNNNALGGAFPGLGGLGGLGAFSAPPQPAGPPEEVYAAQLSQLNDMGFFDTAENIRALQATGGNVHAAVDRLLSSGGAFGGFA